MTEILCSVSGCSIPRANIRGWCVKHYQQWRRHGDPEAKDKKPKTCNVENCQSPRLSKGMCNMHYQRFLKHGDPLVRLGTAPGLPLAERFWSKVDIKTNKECWMWKAGTDKDGYGIFGTEGTTAAKAHRVAYQLQYGTDPGEGKTLHRCDTPGCVNPRHLYIGTPMDNMQDKIVRGRDRYASGEDHYSAKLTNRKVRNIRQAYIDGASLRQLADKYGVTPSNIEQVVKRHTWKHVI